MVPGDATQRDPELISRQLVDMDVNELVSWEKSTMQVRVTLRLIRTFYFLGCIRVAQWVTRLHPVTGDWVAYRLGVTAAYQRAHRWVRELPRPGNGI